MHVASTSVEALNVLDPRSLLSGLGALGVFLVLFAETGRLVGFFLPGDSLTACSDLHPGSDDDGLVAEPLHLAGPGRTRPVQTVNGDQRVAEEERCLRPHK